MTSLAVVAGIGWYGIFARSLYAAPHWVEPWAQVARQAANIVLSGGIVIGNNPSFFFYLTYALPEPPQPRANAHFRGLLPDSSRRTGVYDPQQWLTEGQPLRPTVLLVQGLHYGTPNGPTEKTKRLLSELCALQGTEKVTPDPGAQWKQRLVPEINQPPWRVEVSSYVCYYHGL